MKKPQWVSETELELLEGADAQSTALPNGAVAPKEYMEAEKGLLVKTSTPVYPECEDCSMPYYNCLCSHLDDDSC